MNQQILSPEHVARLEKTLRRQLLQLRKALGDSERDTADLHLQIAGHLRALLCDSKVPVLLVYAEYKSIDLRVWGPNPPGFRGTPGRMAFQVNALIASSQPVAYSYEMSIRDYLDTPIGATPVPDPSGGQPSQTVWYTPRQLIKWVANKEGVAHLELDPPASLRAVQNGLTVFGLATLVGQQGEILKFGATDQFIVRSALLQIGLWTAHAIDRVLAPPISSANKALADAIRAQTRRLLNAFANKANGEIPVQDTEQWVRSTPGEFVRKKSQYVFVERLLYFKELHSEIPQWPEYKVCCELLAADQKLLQIKLSHESEFFSLTTFDVANAIGIGMLRRERSFEYSEELFQQLYDPLEEYLYRSDDNFELVAPIAGLSLTENVDLGPGIRIKKLADEEISQLLEHGLLSDRPMRASNVRIDIDCCVSISVRKTKWDGVEHPLKRATRISEEIAKDLEVAFRALVIHKTGHLQIVGSVLYGRGFFQGFPFPSVTHAIHHRRFRRKYEWSSQDAIGLKEIYQNLVQSGAKMNKGLEFALRRFLYGYERVREEDALVDLMIAAEAMFLREDRSEKELSYRLKLRAARFLSENIAERQAIFKLFTQAYDVRSAVVHGGDPEIPKKKDGSEQSFAAFVEEVEEHLRIALKQLLKLAANKADRGPLVDWGKLQLS